MKIWFVCIAIVSITTLAYGQDTETPLVENPEVSEAGESAMENPSGAAESAGAKPEPVVLDKQPSTKNTKKTQAPESKKKTSQTDSKMKTEGVFGPLMFGPTFWTLSLPALIGGGVEGKYRDVVGFSVDYGVIPKLTFQDVEVKARNLRGAVRYFPFQQSFFVGLGYGQQVFEGSGSKVISGQNVSASAKITTDFLTPMIGWRWLWSSGFFMGLDLGAQIALTSKVTFETNAPAAVLATTDYQNLDRDVRDAGNNIGDQTLPHITLLQVGFLF